MSALDISLCGLVEELATQIFCHVQSLNKKYGCNVPLLLMNSFNTHDDTSKVKFEILRWAVHMHFMSSTNFSFLQIYRLLKSMLSQTLRFIHLTRYV